MGVGTGGSYCYLGRAIFDSCFKIQILRLIIKKI